MKFSIAAIPYELEFHNMPADWEVTQESQFSLAAGARTDWFFDPAGGEKVDNAPAALFSSGDAYFLLSARIRVEFASAFDAGTLQLRAGEEVWGKVCFEYSPQKQPMVVSVVTHGVSDDCNSVPIEGNWVYLHAARLGQAFAFHYSLDKQVWHFVRHFSLGQVDQLRIGLSAQSPTGTGCSVWFSEIEYQTRKLADLRSGV